MKPSPYAARLRYLDADDVDDSVVDFDGLDVRGHDGEKLGDVDGFIVDLASGRVLYVVVDSGGWFRSRRFLAPIGHAVIDHGRRALALDISKDRLLQYPEFDESRFREFTDEDLWTFETRMAGVCCPDDPVEARNPDDDSVGAWAYETRRHYRQPDWWTAGSYVHERLRPVESPTHHLINPPSDDDTDVDETTAH